MDEFSNSNSCIFSRILMRKILLFSMVMVGLVLFNCIFVGSGYAKTGEKIAVLPFSVHALKPMEPLKTGAQEMVYNAIKAQGYPVVDPQQVNKNRLVFKPALAPEEIISIGKGLAARWIVRGSITQVGKKASVDVTIFDISQKKGPYYAFVVADTIEELPEVIGSVADSIINQIMGYELVDEVRIKGNRRIEKEAIIAVIKTRKGGRLDYAQLDKDLRNIYKMGFFDDVQIETEDGLNGKIVTFVVKEKPSIGKIVFEGNKEVDEDDLREELGIHLYSILNPYEIKQSINRLKDFYRQKGFYNVEIKESTEPLQNNEVLLRYEIKENEKVYIKEIKFVGNKKFDDDDLRDLMETKEKGFFSWITSSGYLDKKKLEFDIQKITAFYHNHGFIKAKVGNPKIKYLKGKGLYITISIEEGDQYKVGKVAIKGDLIKPEKELLSLVRIGREPFFSREVIRQDIIRLRDAYADGGYAYAEVMPQTKEDPESKTINVTYKISRGPKVVLERINILGNTVTRDKVIRRELFVEESGYFSGRGLRESMKNLQRLGFFEDVKINTKKGSSEDKMILDVEVKERPTGSFSVGAGYSSVDGPMIMFQIQQTNFLGYGQKVSATASIGGETSEFSLHFVEPWLFDRPISLGLDAYKWKREYDEYTKDSVGGSVSLGFNLGLDRFTRGYVSYTYDKADITDIASDAAYEIRDMAGINVTSSITLTIKRDSRNKPWNPTEGSINSISFEYAGGILGGDVYFDKYYARSAWFFPVWYDTAFMLQGRWGYIKEREGGKLPVYQKFRLGGLNTIRGYEYGDISPLDPVTGDRIGGEKMMVYNVEYRFPLVKDQGIIGLLFYDAGNVFTKDQSWSFSDIRQSVGVGIRWYSPIGPLRLEYGKVINGKEGDPSGNWEFSVGGMF